MSILISKPEFTNLPNISNLELLLLDPSWWVVSFWLNIFYIIFCSFPWINYYNLCLWKFCLKWIILLLPWFLYFMFINFLLFPDIYVSWNIVSLKYLLTPWCRVLLEKLTGLQLVKKFPTFHGTRRFITALTSFRHLSLSWARPIQSIYPLPTSWRSILILSTHLRLGLPSGLFPSGFPTKTLYTPSPRPYAPNVQPISFFSILSPAQYWVRSTNHLASGYAISSIPPLSRPS